MKILCILDQPTWCYNTTARAVSNQLPMHDIDMAYILDGINIDELYGKYDLIWQRAMPNMFPGGGLLGAPWVWSFTSGNFLIHERYPLYQPHINSAAGIITQNEQACRHFSKLHPVVTELPNGVDCDTFRPKSYPWGQSVVGMAANTSNVRRSWKGLEDAVEGCKLVNMSMQQVGAIRKGKGRVKAEVPHSRMADWYNSLTYYLQPSVAEGCSNSVWEAMACGRVCLIVKGVGWHGENCVDGIEYMDGNVVFVEQNAKDIAEKLDYLEWNSKVRQRIALNARNMALEWQWHRVAARFDAFFRKVVNG